MSRFLNLDQPEPHRLFGAVLRRSRLGIRAAYDAAFAADRRCKDLMDEERFLGARGQPFGFPVFGGDADSSRFPTPDLIERRAALWAEAQAEDLQTDFQASIVVLWADDALRRFERDVLKREPNLSSSFGPVYGENVPLTTLLQVATNTLRHVSHWDVDPEVRFPYDPTKAKSNGAKQAHRNIAMLQRAFGIGKHEPIREPVSWRALVAVDGQLGTAPPDFGRFEATIVTAAQAIAAQAGISALLAAELVRSPGDAALTQP